ncbi:MBL fold metallo-hydrolase [Halomarina ordinaria]|uniref:Rhodanese-like domain-containing protein n=1 Tax=Halomarina ordinaria TaxID=3033939 RepID=A0ABD5U4T3_9EURY|nr:MBL fold metallo-hydrolase [Halomarina sp. PSRA2]
MAPELPPEELAALLDADAEFVLVDTRTEESYEAWHVRGAYNYPYKPDEPLSEDPLDALGVGDVKRVVTVCAKGVSSGALADALLDRGYVAANVADGMRGWSRVYEAVPVARTARAEVVQVQRRAKGCLSYVVGCPETSEAVVVDASRHGDVYRETLSRLGYEAVGVLDTHVHADHVSGGRALATALDVPYYLPECARERGVAVEYEALSRNEVLPVGDLDVKALSTPGHTTEMTSYLVDGTAVLTGDSLFVESVGRTELEFDEGEAAADGARMQYRSLHETLVAQPDDVLVCPAHVGVAADGTWAASHPGWPVRARVGDLRTGLDLLGLDEERFVAELEERLPEKPPNYERVIAVNRGRESIPAEPEATDLELGPNQCSAG